MDRRERINDTEEMIRMAFEGMQSGLWTGMPAQVVEYNAATQTCTVQPTVLSRQLNPDGLFTYIALPPIPDCPVQWPGGGGFTLTFPLAAGDEGLVIFASRCIDSWYQNGGLQQPPEIRMHDLSDGFFLPKFRSKLKALANVSTTTTQLRSDDGTTFVEVAGGGIVNVTAPTEINLNTPIVNVQGVINVLNENSASEPFIVDGNIQVRGDVVAGAGTSNISLLNHVHTGVTGGGSNTGGPTG